MNRSLRACLLLVLTALIWGAAFVAQDVAMDTMPPFGFNAIRMALAGLALTPVIALIDRREARKNGGAACTKRDKASRRTLFLCGAACGLCLAMGSGLQQLGISAGSGAGKAGFITALYIVLVPLFELFLGKRASIALWIAVALSAVGLYLLCIKEGLSLNKSDVLLILGAVCFMAHILVIDRVASRVDPVRMSQIQFLVAAGIFALLSAFTESFTLADVRNCLVPILYAGLLSGAVGYTLQIVAQRDIEPTIASLIMCLESVFAVVAGWLLLGERMSARELLGCVAMLGGIALAQLSSRPRKTA